MTEAEKWREDMRKKLPEFHEAWRRGARKEAGLPLTDRKKSELAPDERGWTERDFQKEFNRWMSSHLRQFSTSVLVELKSTPEASIPFDCLRPAQRIALERCSGEGVFHRIESNPYKEQSAKPADAFFIRDAKGYVAVMFRVRQKGNRTFFMINFADWVREEESSDRKSLTEEMAREIGRTCVLL